MIAVSDVSFSYGQTTAVDDVSFEISEAELFGFIGPDGAGKTTLFRILATLLIPACGSATVDGLDVVKDYRALRRRLGYMPGRFSLYQDLTVEENLRFYASVFGTTVEENYDLVRDIYAQIEPFRDRRAGALSGGMKQKLALSCALIHRPRVLLLDEPTTGVDAVSRGEFWEMLSRLKRSGITIVVSTPYMDEASRCDRVALMQSGRLLAIDTPSAIRGRFDHPLLAVRAAERHELLGALRAFPHARSVYPFGEFAHYADQRDDVRPEEIRGYLEQRGLTAVEVHRITADIEDVFMDEMRETEAVDDADHHR